MKKADFNAFFSKLIEGFLKKVISPFIKVHFFFSYRDGRYTRIWGNNPLLLTTVGAPQLFIWSSCCYRWKCYVVYVHVWWYRRFLWWLITLGGVGEFSKQSQLLFSYQCMGQIGHLWCAFFFSFLEFSLW